MIVSKNHPTITWHFRHYDICLRHTGTKRGCKRLLTVFRGSSLGMLWTPSANKNNAHTHFRVQTSSILIRGLA